MSEEEGHGYKRRIDQPSCSQGLCAIGRGGCGSGCGGGCDPPATFFDDAPVVELDLKALTEPRTKAESLARKLAEEHHWIKDSRGLPICHVFEYRGDKLLYAPTSGALMQLTDVAFDVMQAGWDLPVDELAGRALPDEPVEPPLRRDDAAGEAGEARPTTLGDRYSRDEIARTLEDIGQLKKAGMLAAACEPDEKEIEAYIRSLMRHHPYRMSLFVTETCNLRCVYCYEFGEDGSYSDTGLKMTWETAGRAVDYLFEVAAPRKYVSINFFGGEPLMNFPIVKRTVEYCAERAEAAGKSYDFTMTTNAVLLTDRIIDFLVEHNFNLCVSLDGPPEVQDRFRPAPRGKKVGQLTIDRALELHRRHFARHRRRSAIKVRVTCTRENRNVQQLASYFEQLGFTNVGLGAALGKSFHKAWYDLRAEDQLDFFEQQEAYLDRVLDAMARRRRVAYNPFHRLLHRVANPRTQLGAMCGVGRNTNAIAVDGSIYPCHRYMEMQAFRLGDVFNGLDEEKLYQYYRKIVDNARQSCSACWAKRICGSACSWQLSHENGDVFSPDPDECKLLRKGFERGLWLFAHMRDKYPDYVRGLAPQDALL